MRAWLCSVERARLSREKAQGHKGNSQTPSDSADLNSHEAILSLYFCAFCAFLRLNASHQCRHALSSNSPLRLKRHFSSFTGSLNTRSDIVTSLGHSRLEGFQPLESISAGTAVVRLERTSIVLTNSSTTRSPRVDKCEPNNPRCRCSSGVIAWDRWSRCSLRRDTVMRSMA